MLALSINGQDQSHRCVYEIKITSGRSDIESQPDASVCNLTLVGLGPEQVGQTLFLTANSSRIFSGVITDLSSSQRPDMSWTVSVVSTGPLRALGQLSAGMNGYLQETDSVRIANILNEIGVPHNVDTLVNGPTLLPVEAERLDAGEIARQAADNGFGVLWENPTDPEMKISYLPASLRVWGGYAFRWKELTVNWSQIDAPWRDIDSDNDYGDAGGYPDLVAIDPASANAEVVFEQAIGDLVNTVVVQYGIKPETPEGEEEQERPEVIRGEGIPEVTFDTDLVFENEATDYATTMLKRRRIPAWRLTEMVLHLQLLPANEAIDLLQKLVVGLRLSIPFPHNSPVGYQWEGYVEGWQHFITGEINSGGQLDVFHSLTLNVSDRQLTEPANRWVDIEDNWIDLQGVWLDQ